MAATATGQPLTFFTQNNSGAASSAGSVNITAGNGTGTGASNGGSVVIKAGTSTNGTGGTIQLVNLGSAALGTAFLCWNSSGNIVSQDSTCVTSAKETKNQRQIVSSADALSAIVALPDGVPTWDYKSDKQHIVHGGLYADDVEKMDRRCAVYEKGKLRSYEDRCVIGYLAAALKQQQREIEDLKRRVH